MKIQIDQAALEALTKTPEVQRLLTELAEAGAENARRIVPVESGSLQRSIESGFDETKGRSWFGSSKDYAEEVEYGTDETEAQPYLRPSMDVLRGRLD